MDEKRDYYLIGWPQLPSKVYAIKALRNVTSASLKGAKDVMDTVEQDRYARLSLRQAEYDELRESLLLLPAASLASVTLPDYRQKVSVRVAVVVGSNGKWNAAGWSDADGDGKAAMDAALDGFDQVGPEAQYWIEASLPIPQVETIQAEVVPE